MATNEDINIRVHSEGGEQAIGITPEQTERGIGINNEAIVVRAVSSYNDLDDKPQINSVELEGDKSASDLGFADVAMSGSYNDLTDTPEIPAAQVNADWNADSGVAEILNKPTIPTKTSQLDNDSGFLTSESDPVFSASAAATITSQDITDWDNKSDFSGSYNDLTDKPTIPTKTSQLANDGSDGTSTYVEADELATVATSGSYSDLSGTPTIPTKTSDLANDGADGTSTYVEADELATVATSGSYNDLSNRPTIPAAQVNSDWSANSGVAEILNKPNLAAVATSGAYSDLTGTPSLAAVATSGAYSDLTGTPSLATVATSGSYSDLTNKPTIPAAQVNSDWSANSGVAQILNKPSLATVATSGLYSDLSGTPTIPTKTSDLTNDGADNTSTYVEADELATVATSGSYDDLSNTPAIPSYSDFTGATSSVAGAAGLVPAPTTSDPGKYLKGDGTWSTIVPELVEMSYGESNAWAKFIAAYQAKCIVYCRASSAANPASGSQTRKAFMAYVNNADNPTQVEFQYYRSVSSHTDAQQGDQVFIYLLTNASGGTWSVTTRNTFSKVVAGTNMTSTYSNGQITLNATQPTVPTNTSDLTNDSGFITNTVNNLVNYYTKTETDSAIGTETTNRENADQGLQEQIDALASASDVVDVVGTYADLQNYDTSHLNNNDIIKVLTDETHNGAISYYRWNTATSTFSYIGSQGPFYTKSESDATFVPQTRTVNNKALSSNITLTASDVGALPSSTVIPTVNDATLTIQRNGANVQTFTANASSNVTADISVPTKTSDLTNDGSDNTAQYLETDETAYRTTSIPFGQVDATSTSTAFTATVPGITELRDGVCMWLKNGVVTSAAGFTININGLGAKPVYSSQSAATAETTMYASGRTFMFVYDGERVAGGCWVLDRGYNSNDNTIGYQVRTNSQSLPMTSVVYRYRLLFTSADNQHYVPANNSTSTNATASRTVCQDKINPFGRIFYYSATASVAANSRPGSGNLWEQYTIALGYSFNRTGAALTLTSWKPVYIKAAPQSDGSAIIDSTTPYVQDLPTTEDGKIYIFLGVAYSATNIELQLDHPIYHYKDGAIRPWLGTEVPSLYTTTGQNEDGAVTQKLFTDTVGNVETILQTLNNGGGAQ